MTPLWITTVGARGLWMNPTLTPPRHNSHGTAVPRDTVPVTSKYSGAPRPEPKDHTMSENIEDLKAQLAAAEAAAKAAEAEAAAETAPEATAEEAAAVDALVEEAPAAE